MMAASCKILYRALNACRGLSVAFTEHFSQLLADFFALFLPERVILRELADPVENVA